MKKTMKKLIAGLMSVSCMASSMAFNANAVENNVDESYIPQEIAKYLEGYEKFDTSYLLPMRRGSVDSESHIDYYYGGKSRKDILALETTKAHVDVYFKQEDVVKKTMTEWGYMDDFSLKCEIYDYIQEKYPIVDDGFYIEKENENGEKDFYEYLRFTLDDDVITNNAEIRKIIEGINEFAPVYSAVVKNKSYKVTEMVSALEDLTDYVLLSETEVKAVEDYVEEAGLDFSIEKGDDGFGHLRCHLVPNNDMSIDEYFAAASKIKREFKKSKYIDDEGTYMYLRIATDCESLVFNPLESVASYEINVVNNVDGDANLDGKVNIADATLITQHVGNKDKYKISAQGAFNIDLDGNGITGTDAIAIQRRVANMGMPE